MLRFVVPDRDDRGLIQAGRDERIGRIRGQAGLQRLRIKILFEIFQLQRKVEHCYYIRGGLAVCFF